MTATSIDLKESKIFRVQVNEDISARGVQDLVEDATAYEFIEYNSLVATDAQYPAFLRLARTIAHAMDNNPRLSVSRKLVQNLLIGVALFTVVIVIFTTVLGISGHPFFASLHKSVVYIFAFVVTAVSLVAFWFFELPSRLEAINKKFAPRRMIQLNKKIKSEKKTVEGVIDLLRPWFSRKKKYVIVLYYINWEIEEDQIDNHINKFIASLLSIPNLWIIYCIDKNDYLFLTDERKESGGDKREGPDDLEQELKRRNFSVKKIKPQHLYRDILMTRLKSTQDQEFYEQFARALHDMSPNDFELDTLTKYLERIKDDWDRDKNLQLSVYLSKESPSEIRKKKNEIIAEKFFSKENCFKTNNAIDSNLEILLISLLYQYYFLNQPLPATALEKIFLLHFNDSDPKLRLSDEHLMAYLIGQGSPEVSEHLRATYLDGILRSVRELGAVKFQEKSQTFAVTRELWLVHYIISNRFSLSENLEKHVLSTKYLEKSDHYAKFFLFLITYRETVDEMQIEKLLTHIHSEEKPYFLLMMARNFSATPFDDKDSYKRYILGTVMALRFWKSYELIKTKDDLAVDMLPFRVSIKALNIDPFQSLYQVLCEVLHRVNYLKETFESISVIATTVAQQNPFEQYEAEHAAFCLKWKRLQKKYVFYKNEFVHQNEDYSQYPEIELMQVIDDRLIILLPAVEEQYADQVPRVDIAKYTVVSTSDPDFLFLQILAIIHNNYHYIGTAFEPNEKLDEAQMAMVTTKLREFEEILLSIQKKELNYREHCNYTSYDVKYYLIRNLFIKCNIAFDFKFYSANDVYNYNKFQQVIQRFEVLGDYFSIVDTLFWECWFETRLPYTTEIGGTPVLDQSLDRGKVESNIRKIIQITGQVTQYVHFDCGLIYMGILSNSIIEPPTAYTLIHKFLSEKRLIPKFIEFKLLERLSLICFNGQFKDREALALESLAVQRRLLSEFPEFYDKQRRYSALIASMIPLLNPTEDKVELDAIFDEIIENQKEVSYIDLGIFLYNLIDCRYAQGRFEELLDTDYLTQARMILKNSNSKFYYLQFLRNYITRYHARIVQPEIDKAIEQRRAKIDEYKTIEEKNAKLKDNENALGIVEDHERTVREKLNTLRKDIEELARQITSLREVASIKELEEEFETFYKNFVASAMTQGENQPYKYVIAGTSHTLGRIYHDKYGSKNDKTVRYYEIAMHLYYELEEYASFLRIALELKPFYSNRKSIDKLRYIETNVRRLLDEVFAKPGTLHEKAFPDGDIQRKSKTLSHLIYDYLNVAADTVREDYSYHLGQRTKLAKMNSTFDNDSRGLRKLLLLFSTELENEGSTATLFRKLEAVLEYAVNNSTSLSFDDIETFQDALKSVKARSKDSMDVLEEYMALERRVELLKNKYRENMYTFMEEEMSKSRSDRTTFIV